MTHTNRCAASPAQLPEVRESLPTVSGLSFWDGVERLEAKREYVDYAFLTAYAVSHAHSLNPLHYSKVTLFGVSMNPKNAKTLNPQPPPRSTRYWNTFP